MKLLLSKKEIIYLAGLCLVQIDYYLKLNKKSKLTIIGRDNLRMMKKILYKLEETLNENKKES